MKKKGFTLIELLVVIAIIALLMGILMPALNKARQLAIQLVCGTNLKGLSSAMLVYAAYCEDDYPRAGGAGSSWAPDGVIDVWNAPTEEIAFGITYDENGEVTTAGQATVTSSFFLLVKHAKVTPKQFICKGDAGMSEWKFALYEGAVMAGMDMTRCWDFGAGGRQAGTGRSGPFMPFPGEVVSYTYQFPYSQGGGFETFVIVDMSNPSSPVCADRNPYTDKNAPEPPEDLSEYNSASHYNKGQNVLYKDGSVKFENSPCVGVSGDNIWLYRGPGDDPLGGVEPTSDGDALAFPGEESDALLVAERNGRTS